ncbi:hypothetical protein BDV93DRAFT_519756 [Ceratobasidium sp. AG-I]|nr:hypothetical protein BDV93DRAFT_519756 [Ceratobasidium sp. AG-I]
MSLAPATINTSNDKDFVNDDDEDFINDEAGAIRLDWDVFCQVIQAIDAANTNPHLDLLAEKGVNKCLPDPPRSIKLFDKPTEHDYYQSLGIPEEKKQDPYSFVARHFRKLLSSEEKLFWLRMCRPEEPDLVSQFLSVTPSDHGHLSSGGSSQTASPSGPSRSSTPMTRSAAENSTGTPNNVERIVSKRELKRKDHREHRARREVERALEEAAQKQKKARRSGPRPFEESFFNHLAHADYVLWQAHTNIIRCGVEVPVSFSAQKLVHRMKTKRESAKKATASLRYTSTPEEQLKDLGSAPFVLLDSDDVPVLINLPGYFSKKLTAFYTEELEAFGVNVNLQTEQSDASDRGRGYNSEAGRLVGCLNAAIAWVPHGHPQDDPMTSGGMLHGYHNPSSIDPTARVKAFHAMQSHLKNTREIPTLMNYALYRSHRSSFLSHLKMIQGLKEKVAAAKTMATHDPSVLSGRSYIYCRATPAHYDNKESPWGWSPLVVMGDCTEGSMAIPKLGIKFRYIPGAMVFVRGRLLEHGVVDWTKGTRYCVAHFNHTTEWKHTGIEPPMSY